MKYSQKTQSNGFRFLWQSRVRNRETILKLYHFKNETILVVD